MSHVQRSKRPGASIFFTVTLAERGGDTLVRHLDALRDAVRRTKAERPFHIRAMVILPDHLHAIWTLPKGDSDYSTRWSVITARFTQAVPEGRPRVSHDVRGEPGLWQRRFCEHHIRSEAEKRQLTQACWQDPVRHGLVEDPFDWPHSSIHRDAIRGAEIEDVSLGFSHAFFDPSPASDAHEGASHSVS